jgi:hypothetical protein
MITIEKWAGLATNASPYSLPPGAAVTQVNLQIINPGQLVCRKGATTVTFATTSGTTVPVVSAARVIRGSGEKIIHQNNLGQIFVAEGPS